MRSKNGYTLTEILVVVLLLSIVGGIIIFNVNSILNNNKTKSYEKYIAQVKSSAETYASLNMDAVNDLYENKSFTYITVGDLIDHGFLDEKLTNPYTGEKISRNELVKLSLSSETGNLTIMYPVEESNKEVFLSSVVMTANASAQVDCMDGIGTYTLALSDETGKLILDKNTLLNDYKFSCKLPDNFDKTTGTMSNEIGSTDQVGTYEMTYSWISKSGIKGTGKRFLKVVPDTIKLTYNVDVIEGRPVDAWTPATCMGTISPEGVCSKDILVGYNYNNLSRPTRTGYIFKGWFTEKQTDAENPGNGTEITDTTKVLNKSSHTIYAHWERRKSNVILDSTLNGRPAVETGSQSVTAKYNLPLDSITIPRRYYDVVFNLNDASEGKGTTYATSTSSSLVATWDFEGYFDDENKKYISSTGEGITPWDKIEDTILHAKWTNGKITLPDASRTGYIFNGWFTGKNNGEQRNNDYQYELPATLYAHWTAKIYTVTLDYNDNDGGSTKANESISTVEVVFDDDFTSLFNPTRSGYTFEGWYYEDTLITRATRATNDYAIADNNGITLKAKWSKNNYTVTLNKNKQLDMTNEPTLPGSSTLQVTFDEPNNNIVQVPSVTGWTFQGWYTSANVKVYNVDGTYNSDITTYFDSDGEWIYTNDLTLYAHWTQDKYTLTLNLNPNDKMTYETSLVDSSKFVYEMTFDSTENNQMPKATVIGWNFKGWYDEENNMVYDQDGVYVESSTTDYFTRGKWTHEGNVAVYAKWEQQTYSVTLDLNDNDLYDKPTLSVSTYIFIFDDEITENINVPSYLDGYEFLGWYENDKLVFNVDGSLNADATDYFLNNKWIKNESVELRAKWKANGYVVTFKQPLATKKGTETIFVNYNSALPSITIPERKYSVTYNVNDEEGSTRSTRVNNETIEWDFDGYFTERNNQYYNGSGETSIIYREASDIDLYEKWSGGTITNIPEPTRVGYTFGGWYLEDTFDTKVENGYEVTSDVELYAKWTANKYTITFNNNKASIEGTTSLEVTFDSDVESISIPEKKFTITLDKNYEVENRIETKTAEWTFKGYYTQMNGVGTRYFDAEGNASSKYLLSEDLTLYAYYTGGTIELPEYTREDYIFNGWYNASVKAEETDTYEENTTLVIHWNSEEYNLTLNVNRPVNMSTIPSIANDSYIMAMHTTDNNVINVPTEIPGWIFKGWYDGDTLVFNENGEYQTSAESFFDSEGNWIKKDNVTLYAHWEAKTYSLTLNTNKPDSMEEIPSISTNTYILTYDEIGVESVAIPDHVFGYTFEGYYYNDEIVYDTSGYRINDNSVFDSTGKFIIADSIELKARWSEYPNILELVINKLDTMEDIPRITISRYEMTKSDTNNNRINIPTSVTGFNFLGWYDEEDVQVYDENGNYVEGEYFDSEGNWLKDNGARLLTKYEPVKSLINLDINSPVEEIPDISESVFIAEYAGTAPETLPIPSEIDNYIFEGWYYEDTKVYDETGNKVLSVTQFFDTTGKWLYLDNVICEAKWTHRIYVNLTIEKEDLMDITPEVTNSTYEMRLNSISNNTIDVPTIPKHYTFLGWYDDETQVYDETGKYNSSATSYFNSKGEWIRDADVTLKARWTHRTEFTLTLSNSGHEDEFENIEYTMKMYSTMNNHVHAPLFGDIAYLGWYYPTETSEETEPEPVPGSSLITGGSTLSGIVVFDRNGNWNPDATEFFNENGEWIYFDDVELFLYKIPGISA